MSRRPTSGFGGSWTETKLACVEEYLTQWAKVLKNQRWRRRYIDAFSGSGRWESHQKPKADFVPIFENGFDIDALREQEQVLDGSARRAITVEPPFHRIDLIEKSARKAEELRRLTPGNSDQIIEVYRDDANDVLRRLCMDFDRRRERGVLFLDPFGCQVEWSTLEAVRNTRAIDVWYLFPAGGLNRLLHRVPGKIEESWAARLTNCLGTEEWRSRFYPERLEVDLFGQVHETTREAGPLAVEQFFMERLTALFPATADHCIRLMNGNNSHMFSLCFAMANPDGAAVGAATRIANHLIDRWSKAG